MQWVYIILAYLVLNGVLYGAQELYYLKDTQQINAIQEQLDSEEKVLTSLNNEITGHEELLNEESQRLTSLKQSGNIYTYNSGVDAYNLLLNNCKYDISSYNSRASSYNLKVDEINALINKSGSRWWLIPIPLGKSSRIRSPVK